MTNRVSSLGCFQSTTMLIVHIESLTFSATRPTLPSSLKFAERLVLRRLSSIRPGCKTDTRRPHPRDSYQGSNRVPGCPFPPVLRDRSESRPVTTRLTREEGRYDLGTEDGLGDRRIRQICTLRERSSLSKTRVMLS